MQTQIAHTLGRMARLEETLADLVTTSIARVPDSGMKNRMRRVAERHRKHNEALLGLPGVERASAEEVAEDRDGLRRRIENAEGADGLMATLGHIELEQQARLEDALLQEQGSETVRKLLAEKDELDEDIRSFLEARSDTDPATGFAGDVESRRGNRNA